MKWIVLNDRSHVITIVTSSNQAELRAALLYAPVWVRIMLIVDDIKTGAKTMIAFKHFYVIWTPTMNWNVIDALKACGRTVGVRGAPPSELGRAVLHEVDFFNV